MLPQLSFTNNIAVRVVRVVRVLHALPASTFCISSFHIAWQTQPVSFLRVFAFGRSCKYSQNCNSASFSIYCIIVLNRTVCMCIRWWWLNDQDFYFKMLKFNNHWRWCGLCGWRCGLCSVSPLKILTDQTVDHVLIISEEETNTLLITRQLSCFHLL